MACHAAGVSDPGSPEGAGGFAALAELAEVFAALVEALAGDDPLANLSPRRILELAATCVPEGHDAALTTRSGDRTEVLAVTSELPERIARIRAETGQGPTLDVLDTNDLVVSNDLADEPRWPLFGGRVVDATGVRSILSYRLYLGPRHRSALSFYSNWPYAYDNLAITTGAIFAAYCSLVTFSHMVLDEPVAERRAADVHREIGVAIGILMANGDLSTEAAYQQLHNASRRLQRSLPDVARTVIARRHLMGRPDDGQRGH